MKKNQFTEAQIAFALREAESGTPVGEVIRKMGISEVTFYRWKKKYVGMGVSELPLLPISLPYTAQIDKQMTPEYSFRTRVRIWPWL